MVKEYSRILDRVVWSSDRMDLEVKVLLQIGYVHQRGSASIRAERERLAPFTDDHTVHTDYSLGLGTESSGCIGEFGAAFLRVDL